MSLTTDDLLYIGMKGHVLAINRHTGEEIWRQALKSSGFVNVLLENGAIFAATRGELWCLDPCTGAVRWTNPLKGMGFGLISFASAVNQVALAEQIEADARSSDSSSHTASM